MHRPLRLCVDSLLKRRQLSCRRVYTIESSCIDLMTPQSFAEQLARVSTLMKSYSIHDTSRIVNLDQAGASFQEIVSQSISKDISKSGVKPI